MAFENKTRGNFFTIYNGKFSQRVPEGTVGATSRVNKEGKTVHERYYESFTAKLIDIKTQDGNYGKNWLFSFQDGGEVFILQLPYSNSFATAFLKMLPNIDVSKEMTIEPDSKVVDGKTKSSLFVKQGGVNIKHAYTKDAPNGLPDLEQVQVKGQMVWDDTKRIDFLYNMVQTQIVPKLPGNASVGGETAGETALSLDDIPTSADAEEEQPF